MKKLFFSTVIALSLISSTLSLSAHAAESNLIIIDGVSITSDVQPRAENGRILVPLRVISESLGANVDWSGSEIIIIKDEMKITLNLNSNIAVKNEESIQLDVKPSTHNNRTLVPLRFIAESFGCTVNYSNGVASVDTAPLFINGAKVTTFQQEYRMIIGGFRNQISAKLYNAEIYNILHENIGTQVDAPASYDVHPNWDVPGSYIQFTQYNFLDSAGQSIQRYETYNLIGASNFSGFPEEQLKQLDSYPESLIHDVTNDKWYIFNKTANESIDKIKALAEQNGVLTGEEI